MSLVETSSSLEGRASCGIGAFDTTKPANRDTNPPWLHNLQGVRPVLWMLPELRKKLAGQRRRFVIVPEGEKDVARHMMRKLQAMLDSEEVTYTDTDTGGDTGYYRLPEVAYGSRYRQPSIPQY